MRGLQKNARNWNLTVAFWATCKMGQPIQPLWQQFFALKNAVKYWKDFLLYFTALETYCDLSLIHTKKYLQPLQLDCTFSIHFLLLRSKSNKWCVKFPLPNIYKVNITIEKKIMRISKVFSSLIRWGFLACNFSKSIMYESHGCSQMTNKEL